MMREILFRGKRLDNGEWVIGAYCPKNSDGPFGPMVDKPAIIKLDPPLDGFWFDVDPDTVGQYTGLKDKNGKRIFEGDLLRISERGRITDDGVVIFENGYPGGWLLTDLARVSKCSLAMRTDVEILGNIHDTM